MGYVYFATAADQSQAAFLESLFRSGGIRYIIANEMTSRVMVFPLPRDIVFMVHPADIGKAGRLMENPVNGHSHRKRGHGGKGFSRRGKENSVTRDVEEKTSSGYETVSVAAFFILLALLVLFGLATSC